MDVWRDVILILAVLGIFILGFYLMTKMDKILEENRRAIEKESVICKPPYVCCGIYESHQQVPPP